MTILLERNNSLTAWVPPGSRGSESGAPGGRGGARREATPGRAPEEERWMPQAGAWVAVGRIWTEPPEGAGDTERGAFPLGVPGGAAAVRSQQRRGGADAAELHGRPA
ncbi:hypothetical protein NDU88_001797 [Pleurodeles waltl]|uniref:Uncharacterized protein n=1 Tax=Pleurodeles waltl TaxID=8319 RepID=A0AAV7LAK1_PLEWA|nr:hypothetical protein NDU88_001797 [Pleurodeles waltl]